MDLAERLRRLGYTPAATAASSPPRRSGLPLEATLEGAWRDTTHGPCYVGRSVYARTHRHGGVPLDGVYALPGDALNVLGRMPGLGPIDFERVVFLDTETTGLAGGTGTYVFLVGLGYFHGDEFWVDQFFMDDYGQERAMLAAMADVLAGFDTLVTFNGKTFDWPLLQTRYSLARQPLPLADPRHLDMLYPSRRVWRERLGSCSLSSLEASVLGVRRQTDVPSWLIPGIYFDYVRERDAGPLRPVFAHNEQDILSLLALTVHLGRHLAAPTGLNVEPVDLYSLGRVFEGAEEWERAILCYEESLARPLPLRTREQAACRLGLVYKRLQRSVNAVSVWESLVGNPGITGLVPFVELAKHLEHAERDYATAIDVVTRAIDRLDVRSASVWPNPAPARERAALSRRLERLRAKQARASATGGEVVRRALRRDISEPSLIRDRYSVVKSEENSSCG